MSSSNNHRLWILHSQYDYYYGAANKRRDCEVIINFVLGLFTHAGQGMELFLICGHRSK